MSSVIQGAEFSLSLVEQYGYSPAVSLIKKLSKSDTFGGEEKQMFVIAGYRLDKIGKQGYRRRLQRIISTLKKSSGISEHLQFKAQLSTAVDDESSYTHQIVDVVHAIHHQSDIQTESVKESSVGLTVKGAGYTYHRALDEDLHTLLGISD